MAERNVGTKGICPKQGLTSVKDLTGLHTPHLGFSPGLQLLEQVLQVGAAGLS